MRQAVSLSPNHQTGGPVHRIYNPRGMVAHFSRLLRHAMGYIGTILIPGHHTGMQGRLQLQTVA